jgi:beta-lactamase regulating signal transducer with metallopeptidase domain
MTPESLLPFANHLWQSTLFAAVAGALTLFLRTNRAHVGYCVWLAASLKFLIPFSFIVAAGSLIGHHTAAAKPPSSVAPAAGVSSAMIQAGAPFPALASSAAMPAVPRSFPSVIAGVVTAIWAMGFGMLVCRWILRARRLRSLVENGTPQALPIAFPVRSSPAFGV